MFIYETQALNSGKIDKNATTNTVTMYGVAHNGITSYEIRPTRALLAGCKSVFFIYVF